MRVQHTNVGGSKARPLERLDAARAPRDARAWASESALPIRAGARERPFPMTKARSATLTRLAKRVLAGCVLGAGGAAVVIAGGFPFFLAILFFAYQASREYFGFVKAVSDREGHTAAPGWFDAAVTLCCMAIPAYTFVTSGGIAVGLAVSSFAVLSVIAKGTEEPKLSHLSSAVFGLVYCGALLTVASPPRPRPNNPPSPLPAPPHRSRYPLFPHIPAAGTI
jgi:Cytidylyltransferase family